MQINKWKEKYGKIYRITIDKQEYIYRVLNVGEIAQILPLLGVNDIASNDIVLNAVLYPEDFNKKTILIKTANQLIECILHSTKAFSDADIQSLILTAKQKIEDINIFQQWMLSLMQIFPGYTLQELRLLTPDEFFELLMIAEKVTGKPLINYKSFTKNSTPSPVPDTNTTAAGNKFLSKTELDTIAASSATENLNNLWSRIKRKK